MNRFAAPLLFAALIVLSPSFTQDALACSCGGRPDPAMAMSSATAVFAGRVVAADRTMARFQVERIWKGKETAEIVMLTGTKIFPNGTMSSTSCDYYYAQGQQYVVYATATGEGLLSPGCSRTGPLEDSEVRALDRVVPHKRIAIEEQRCAVAGLAAGEIQVLAVNSEAIALGSVRTLVEGAGGNFSSTTDNTGRTIYKNLTPGEYTITAESDGYAPRRYKLQLPSQGCVVASIVLLPRV
jgi:hypothetical protein